MRHELCSCGHSRGEHLNLMMGEVVIETGHGACGRRGCPCERYRWVEIPEMTDHDLEMIRKLDDFDLAMLVSEIDNHGWLVARKTLKLMLVAARERVIRDKQEKEE